MFKIFDRNHKQIDILENPYNAIITDELNGIGELKFTVPITYKKLQLEGYVQVKDGHEYVIKEITTEGRERNVHCVLNIEELLGMVHTTFTSKENNLNDTMMIILNGTTWTHVNNSTRTYTRNLYGTVVSSYHMLQLMSTVFDVEFYFDTHKKIVYIVDRVGEDNGTYFINDLNLKQLSQDTHTHNLITRVIPLGKDNLNISEVNGGKMWLENHTYSNKIIYGVWQATDYDNATHLKEDAQRYLDEMAIPYESYEIQVTDISKLANNPDFRYELGDVITIIDNLTETRIKQRICRKIYNLQDPDADIINIASKDRSFEDYYKRIQTVADMTDKVINTDGTINSEAIDKIPADKIIGDIQSTGIKADSITADHIKAEQIQAKHITADAISANHIKANSIQATHLQANSIASEHIQTGAITAGSGIIADGAIGNAQIADLDASKLTAGTIDTSDITIAGANQNLRITGNRLQVFEGVGSSQKERVSLGDVNADGSVYGIRVRGKDGTTVLFDDNGVTKEGITDGSITNDKINPNANIDASKININSVINRINSDGSTNIQGNRISIDNKSLSSVISEINTKDSAQDKTISSQASSIKANTDAIKLKVDTQTYNADKTNMTTTMNKNTSDINVMKGQIALKVEQTDINSAINSVNTSVDTKIASAKSEIKATTDSITSKVEKTISAFSDNLLLNSNFTDSTKKDNYWGKWQGELYLNGDIVGFPVGEGIGISSTVDDACTINSHDVQAKTGDTFTVSGTYRMERNVGLMKVMIRAFQGNYATWHDYFVDIANDGTDTVKTFSETFKIQAGNVHAVSVILWNITPTTVSSSKRIFFNRIKLERGDTKTDWSDHPLKYSHYTKSEVQQKVDSVEYKFQQSGGSNLLYNSNFANKGFDKWFFVNGGWQYTDFSHIYYPEEGWMQLVCKDGTNFHFGQDVRNIKGNTKYTFSVKLTKEHNVIGATPYVDFYDINGNWITGYGGNEFEHFKFTGEREYRTFTTPHGAVRMNFFIEHLGSRVGGGDYSLIGVYRPCLTEGDTHAGWSPHPSELHDGITKIDKDGITVSMSNGEGSQGYSKLDYEGLSIYNAQGQRKAWFGDDNTAYIDSLSANTIRSRDLVRYGHSRPTMYYVSTYSTGDGTGRDANNRANSINRVFEYIREQHGAYSVCHNIVIEVWGGSYYEDVYIGGWLGSGCIDIYFGTDVVWYGGFTIEENTMPVGLHGQGNPFSWVGGAIIEGRRNEPIIVRNSFVHINGFRSRPIQYPEYGSNFVWAQQGSHVVITNCDLVKYWSIATGRYGYVHMEDCCGDIAQTLNQFWSSTFISKGVYTPLLWNGFGTYWNTHYDWTDNGHNSTWIPKNTAPPVVTPTYQWFENTFSLTNLRTVPEGSGSGTSSRSGEWGQGKWGSYKPHRGYANVNASGWCSGGRNFSAYLTLTRSSSGHGYAGAVPVPKIKRPDGSFWSCGVAFARGATHTFQLPSDIANAIANGSMTTLEMWAGTSTNDYSFYNSGSVRIVCEKQV